MRSHDAPMATVLTRIAERVRREPTVTFANVWHVMTEEFLADCFHSLRPEVAAGVDSVTYRWLNRRSQRRSWTWEAFAAYVARFPLPRATCRVRWADS